MSQAALAVDAREVVDFWFAPAQARHWFAASEAFDERIRRRFAAAVGAALDGRLDGWADAAGGWLALLLLLDQFPRNIHRGTPAAWAGDVRASRLALSGLSRGMDRQLPAQQRVFAYLPLEHAEDSALQQRSVALFEALAAEVGPAQRERFAGYLDYARRHRDVIARFGRFPHRNAALGRASSAEEARYLAETGAGF
ncbi:MAG: DUF924 domain-containing protein [Xanthomonadaceae bacterium]|nr:DUF924 domain-containing protein [Xanthomonadaceae bacterium]